jgi:hypothetical protein
MHPGPLELAVWVRCHWLEYSKMLANAFSGLRANIINTPPTSSARLADALPSYRPSHASLRCSRAEISLPASWISGFRHMPGVVS